MKKAVQKNIFSFYLNIVLPSVLAILLFIFTLFYLVIPYFESSMMDRKREMISELTHTATSILDKYYKDELDGILSREEAQKTAVSRIQYLRYGEENKDYFWITDMHPRMVVHPYRPELNGQDLSSFEDSHGKKMFIEFVNVAKNNGHGFVDYMWQWKDDSTYIVPKLSYVKTFKPWGWIVGTGIYIEDVKSEIAELSKTFTRISFLIACIITLILFYVSRQSFKIEKKRGMAEDELTQTKEKYRTLVEASTEGLIMYMDNKITFVNAIFEKMSGQSSSEILQSNIYQIIKIPNEIKDKIDNNQFNFKQVSVESIVYGNNNKKNDVVLNISPLIFYGKEAVIFSVRDVSSDKLIKKQLSYSRDKFQSLMDKLNQGIFRTSLDKKGQFLEANNTALKILGYSSFTEISKMYILDLFVDFEDKKFFRKNLLERGFVKNKIIKLKQKNGHHIFGSVSLVVIYDGETPKFCDGIIEDVTYKNTEDVLVDSVNNSFIAFSQLFYQPISNFSNKPQFCNFDDSVKCMLVKLRESPSSIILVKAESGEVLGYINDEVIRKSFFAENSFESLKCYQIMRAPIPSVYESSMVLDALNSMQKEKTKFLALTNNAGDYISYINDNDLLMIQEFLPVSLMRKIENATSVEDLKLIRVHFIFNLLPIIEGHTRSSVIFNNLSFISDLLTKRVLQMGLERFGNPPVPFAFVSMGSEGRKEQTLKTDQDNAIIYADPEKEIKLDVENYFNKLAEFINTSLNVIGYNFCKGNNMAMNSQWCKPISVWKEYFNKWINNGKAQDLLDICIFFDFRFVYGDEKLPTELKTYVHELTKRNPAYLYHLAQSTLQLKPQVGFWGNILLETAGAPPETVDIKKAIMPIVNFVRIYALKNNIQSLNTIDRLTELQQNNMIQKSTVKDVSQAFDYLAHLRLQHQTFLLKNNINPDNLINTKLLSELDKTTIKKVLTIINNMLSKLNFDFKGSY